MLTRFVLKIATTVTMIRPMAIPILTYHSARISGNDYGSNDHVAFREDLRLLDSMGLEISELSDIVKRLRSGDDTPRGQVAITFDDGTDFDFLDLPHPTWGNQRSMLNIMRDFIEEFGPGAQPHLHATAFVIVSPAARKQIDRTCLANLDWYTDDWWAAAIDSGLMAIANHSWDHLHPSLEIVAQREQEKGSFAAIDTYADADAQIRQATDYLMYKTQNRACPLFAYPYGETNEYLTSEYFPNFESEHCLQAAFTAAPELPPKVESIWALPRLVFGHHWTSRDGLAAILARAQS
jgi:peptidoglycan/xylan/chitin deacetylase (PgdA/CDA1 family)